jgi:hypothetical protein
MSACSQDGFADKKIATSIVYYPLQLTQLYQVTGLEISSAAGPG